MSDRARLVTKAEVFQLLLRDGKVVGLSAFIHEDVLGVLPVVLSVLPFYPFVVLFSFPHFALVEEYVWILERLSCNYSQKGKSSP